MNANKSCFADAYGEEVPLLQAQLRGLRKLVGDLLIENQKLRFELAGVKTGAAAVHAIHKGEPAVSRVPLARRNEEQASKAS